ncbi:MAG: YgfZ/GcvT domain-containing protein [Acidimicrobiia bacterium]
MTALARLRRDVVVVSGPDALDYLQNLVSQDLDGLTDGDAVHSLLLTPQGKLDVDFWLVQKGDGAWLVCEGGFGEQLVESLQRFKIRVQVEVAVDPSLSVVALRGTGARAAAGSAEVVIAVPWAGAGGEEEAVDVVGDGPTLDTVAGAARAAGAQEWSDDEYEAARIAAGVPRLGLDLDAKTIPQEAYLERDAVSFSKGCFLGQELVCRLDTRGHVNRYLRRLTVAEGASAPRGAEIVAGDKAVGTVTSAAGSVALGYVRREVEPPAEVILRSDGSETTATVAELPTA